jgi:hypothetical protein
MKKTILSLASALVMLFINSSANAGENPVNPRVQNALKTEFAEASNVNWERIGDGELFHASFILYGDQVSAWFDKDGGLVATGRTVDVSAMSLLAQRRFRDRYFDYTISEVVEYIKDGELSYIVTAYNQKQTIVAQLFANGSSTIIRTHK